ncbi:unnamed protein product, partial [Clonostachys chloroleuca]
MRVFTNIRLWHKPAVLNWREVRATRAVEEALKTILFLPGPYRVGFAGPVAAIAVFLENKGAALFNPSLYV